MQSRTRSFAPLALAALALLLTTTSSTRAEMAIPRVQAPSVRVHVADIIQLGSKSATVNTEIVFQNDGEATRRIVFASRDAAAFSCSVDGDAVIRSRSTQYLLRPGAEMSCSVRPGRYRYTTLTQTAGGIEKVLSTLRVRSRS